MAAVGAEHGGIFVGRRREFGELIENIRSGTHTILVGRKGIGKSALLEQACLALEGRHRGIEFSERYSALVAGELSASNRPRHSIIVVKTLSPFTDCLRELARELWTKGSLDVPGRNTPREDWDVLWKRFRRLGRIEQLELIRSSVGRLPDPRVVVFDSLDRIAPSHQKLLEDLFQTATVVAAASHLSDAIHYTKIWSTFSQIDIGPLPHGDARELIERLVDALGLRVCDRRLFIREVLKSSAGSPFHIRLGVWKSSRRRSLDRNTIRSLRRTEVGEYFNMGPIYIFGASIFTLYKILSIGMDNREFYIYFSALGFFVYLTFRVFRNFFLFRPQRRVHRGHG